MYSPYYLLLDLHLSLLLSPSSRTARLFVHSAVSFPAASGTSRHQQLEAFANFLHLYFNHRVSQSISACNAADLAARCYTGGSLADLLGWLDRLRRGTGTR
ncbi:hypothetical protein CI102_5586 [Trichoderma harzianum]|nr:hypothetical protein CI102_5586 [Trichoderma harzianum]